MTEIPVHTIPAGPWKPLLERALFLLEDLSTVGGVSDPFWTLGGGTVLMFRHNHRASKDVDVFVSDPQYLGYLTPRLSDKAADMTSNYVEDSNSYVKLQFEEGEIDFVAATNLLEDAWEWWEMGGQKIRVETSAEIIVKKMYHRGQMATARDLFDLSMVIEQEPDGLLTPDAAPFLLKHRQAFIERINKPSKVMVAAFEAIDKRDFKKDLDACIKITNGFLNAL